MSDSKVHDHVSRPEADLPHTVGRTRRCDVRRQLGTPMLDESLAKDLNQQLLVVWR